MKKLIFTLLGFVAFLSAQSQSAAETQVRTLEQSEVQAILSKDTSALKKLWSTDLMTNSSAGRVNIGRQIDFVKNGLVDVSAYSRVVEQVRVEGDIAVTMGSETVTPVGSTDKPGIQQQRRVTSVWMKQNGIWRLIARQTSEQCKN